MSDAETDLHTEEDRGTSFRPLLCIAFDLAVLISYAREPFFHFVYHDGGLERLQNKLMLAFLDLPTDTGKLPPHGEVVDRFQYLSGIWTEWQTILSHPRALQIAGELGYNFDGIDESALKRRYLGTIS